MILMSSNYDHVSTLDTCLSFQHEVYNSQALQASAAATTDRTAPTSSQKHEVRQSCQTELHHQTGVVQRPQVLRIRSRPT